MGFSKQLAAICAAASLTVLSATAAYGDTIYNDLDVSVDSDMETMNLTYDTVNFVGSTGTTTLAIQIDGKPGDHAGCNIQGGPHFVAVDAASSDTSVATVALSDGGVFDDCGDTVIATVTAHALGTSTVTFAIDSERTSNDPSLTFKLDEAAFMVNVTPLTNGGGGSVCDADPAAPAWAAAILKANGMKPNSAGFKNYISQVAGAMTPGAVFGGYAKNDHSRYEDAVLAYLRVATGNPNLVMGSRPGWECHPLSTS